MCKTLQVLRKKMYAPSRADDRMKSLDQTEFKFHVQWTFGHNCNCSAQTTIHHYLKEIKMTLQKIGGLAALVCAATYLFGFAFLVTVLAPLGFGTGDIDASAVVAFIDAQPGLLIVWNTVIYILNAFALAVLVVALDARLTIITPEWAAVTRALGLIWATLVLGAGMMANVTVEHAASLFVIDPIQAAEDWALLQVVELGLGGGNEIAGGVWILLVSIAGIMGRSLGKITIGLGLLTGAGGLATLVPAIGDVAGAVFGLGAIAWFIAVGLSMTLANVKNVRRLAI